MKLFDYFKKFSDVFICYIMHFWFLCMNHFTTSLLYAIWFYIKIIHHHSYKYIRIFGHLKTFKLCTNQNFLLVSEQLSFHLTQHFSVHSFGFTNRKLNRTIFIPINKQLNFLLVQYFRVGWVEILYFIIHRQFSYFFL